MAVVEAMAAGCVPVVPRVGGPWQDILDGRQGAYGFSYQGPEEAAELIDWLIRDEGLRGEVSRRARERCRLFDQSVFHRRIQEIVGSFFS